MKIRLMDQQDIDGVMEVERLSFSIPWTKNLFRDEIINNRHAIYIVAEVDEKIVGYGGMWEIVGEAHITNIAVHPEFRRIGVGNAILSSLVEIATQKRMESMMLEVRQSNIEAQRLYCSHGFESVGIRKGYYSDNNEDAILMTLELDLF